MAENQTQVFCRSCKNSKLLSPFSRPAPSFDVEGSYMDVHLYKNKKKKAEKHTHEIREAFYMAFKWLFYGAFYLLSQHWGV